METPTQTDPDDINPVADFDHQLRLYLTVTHLPNAKQDLLDSIDFVTQLNEVATRSVLLGAAARRNIDIKSITDNRAALELLLAD